MFRIDEVQAELILGYEPSTSYYLNWSSNGIAVVRTQGGLVMAELEEDIDQLCHGEVNISELPWLKE